jgi:hypothetical protein
MTEEVVKRILADLSCDLAELTREEAIRRLTIIRSRLTATRIRAARAQEPERESRDG